MLTNKQIIGQIMQQLGINAKDAKNLSKSINKSADFSYIIIEPEAAYLCFVNSAHNKLVEEDTFIKISSIKEADVLAGKFGAGATGRHEIEVLTLECLFTCYEDDVLNALIELQLIKIKCMERLDDKQKEQARALLSKYDVIIDETGVKFVENIRWLEIAQVFKLDNRLSDEDCGNYADSTLELIPEGLDFRFEYMRDEMEGIYFNLKIRFKDSFDFVYKITTNNGWCFTK